MSNHIRQFTLKEFAQLFVLTSFSIHVMAILNTLYLLPAWSLYMSLEEIIGTISYTLTFILIETILMFLGLVFIGVIWPRKWIKLKSIFISLVFLLEFVVGTIIFRIFVIVKQPYGLMIAISLIILFFLVYRKFRAYKIGVFLLSVAERVSVLTFIYLFFDFFGVIIVLVRNF